MCGFCGFSGTTADSEQVIHEMMEKISHRGPDSSGTYVGEKMVLGFKRLAVIGLADGRQPLYNEDRNLVLVFNGEIYNHNELRAALIAKGHTFSSSSDAETILHMYEDHGVGALSHIRGMFAFAIYDIKNDRMFAARDPFGIKPFYYCESEMGLLFGSEIKCFTSHPGFKKVINTEALAHYLTFQYSVLPETFFKGVYKLLPGYHLVWEKGALSTHKHHSHIFTPVVMDFDTAAKNIDTAVKDSVRKHLESDVEVGCFLSGGVDSCYIAALFGGKKTFSVGFDYDNYNEISMAKEHSLKYGAENISKVISVDEFWEVLPKVQYHLDEPLADPSAVALYFVSELASKHVKVALSGEGADELFGGYNIYKEPISLMHYTLLPLRIRKFLARVAEKLPVGTKGRSFLIRGSKSLEERYIGGANIFSHKERAEVLKKDSSVAPRNLTVPYYDPVSHEDDITKMQFLDIHLWLAGDILLKADKLSMAHGLEVRVPYLDREVFRVASRIPVGHRVSKNGTKLAFRRAASTHMPPESANRTKLGFPIPIRIWLKEEKYYNIVKRHFTSSVAEQFFHQSSLITLLDDHYNGIRDNSRKIWTVFMFLIWYDVFFKGDDS